MRVSRSCIHRVCALYSDNKHFNLRIEGSLFKDEGLHNDP